MARVERCQCEYRKGGSRWLARLGRCRCAHRRTGSRWFVQLVWYDFGGNPRPIPESQCPHYHRKADAVADVRRRDPELK